MKKISLECGRAPQVTVRVWLSGARVRGQDAATAQDPAVPRLLRGEDLETVSLELGVTAATLSGWHASFLATGEAAQTSRATTDEELESDRLKAKLGAVPIERDLQKEKIALLEAERSLA
jgi:transposase-like protein